MLFGQLNKCHSLREITLGLGGDDKFLRDINLEQSPAKSTMSDSHENRNWQVFEDLYKRLLSYYGNVFSKRPEYKEIKEIEGKNIKLIDASIMTVCLSLFEWAEYRTAKGGIKLHASLDERTLLPNLINITEAKVSDRRGVDGFRYAKDTIVVDDRGYFDFKLFAQRIEDENILVTRIKSNTKYNSIEERDLPENKDEHILKDEIIQLTGDKAVEAGIENVKFRRVTFYHEETNRKTGEVKSKAISLITNNLEWSASTIAELYKRRWYIETFFKLLKQNLQIKSFLGTSPNACKSQIFIAIISYFLLELIRRTMSKIKHRFGHFVTLIRVCLIKYNLLEYVVNDIRTISQKVKKYEKNKNDGQLSFNFG
jgi:IS4 transposase